MSRQEVFLGRQPILDREGGLFAYELLFRTGFVNKSNVTDDLHATASVISHTFGQMGAANVLGHHKGFINVSADLLHNDIVEFLPREQVVLELLETVSASPDVVKRCGQLRADGFSLALDDFVYDPSFDELLDLVDYIKIDLLQHHREELPEIVSRLRGWPARLLAEKVDSPEQAEYCKSLGFELFQGYYFARPDVLTTSRPDPTVGLLLRLLNQILGDSESSEIFDTIKQDAGLTYNLLRLVNSAAAGLARPIDSVSSAVFTLGRRQLQRWVQLLLYASQPGTDYPNPLTELASMRGKTMELLALRLGHDSDFADRAFMTGTLSLLDAVLHQPMAKIVSEIGLVGDITDALLERRGRLGTLLALVIAIELNDPAAAERLVEQLTPLTLSDVTKVELEAIRWVVALGEKRN
jgi:EAL and modified HD-GYP domain-containing signal transduction protein